MLCEMFLKVIQNSKINCFCFVLLRGVCCFFMRLLIQSYQNTAFHFSSYLVSFPFDMFFVRFILLFVWFLLECFLSNFSKLAHYFERQKLCIEHDSIYRCFFFVTVLILTL